MPRHIPLVGVETEPRINEWVDNVIMFSAPFCSVLFCSCAFFVQALIMPAIHALHILFFIIDTLLSHVILNIVNEMSYIFCTFRFEETKKLQGKKHENGLNDEACRAKDSRLEAFISISWGKKFKTFGLIFVPFFSSFIFFFADIQICKWKNGFDPVKNDVICGSLFYDWNNGTFSFRVKM